MNFIITDFSGTVEELTNLLKERSLSNCILKIDAILVGKVKTSSDSLIDECRRNNFTKLECIKFVRGKTGMALKEAKDWIEKNMPEHHPDNY